jgi:hypothetical protein
VTCQYFGHEINNENRLIEFEIIVALTIQSTIFREVMPCSQMEIHFSFGGIYHYHLCGEKGSILIAAYSVFDF